MASGSKCEYVVCPPSGEQDKYLLLNLSKAAGSCSLKELGRRRRTKLPSQLGMV